MLDILKQYRKKIIIYGIIGFIGCLFIIQLPFWIGEIKVIIKTHFEAPDVLGFLGDYIAAFGTLILGWVAIKQADKANSISDRVADLEAAKHTEEHNPVILIEWVKLHDFSYNDVACKVGFDGRLYYIDAKYENNINEGRQCIEVNFINTGRSGIYNCKLEKVTSEPEELKENLNVQGLSNAPFVLEAGKKLKINLFVYSNVVERFAVNKIEKMQLIFSCVNDFNEKCKLIFDVEGTTIFAGNNRYESQLVPCAHPVKWEFKVENEDTCI